MIGVQVFSEYVMCFSNFVIGRNKKVCMGFRFIIFLLPRETKPNFFRQPCYVLVYLHTFEYLKFLFNKMFWWFKKKTFWWFYIIDFFFIIFFIYLCLYKRQILYIYKKKQAIHSLYSELTTFNVQKIHIVGSPFTCRNSQILHKYFVRFSYKETMETLNFL